MPVSDETYVRVALEDGDGIWELHCGEPVQKPPMAAEHNQAARILARRIMAQLPETDYAVAAASARLRYRGSRYLVPDLVVIPMRFLRELRAVRGTFEAYALPMPCVVEIWSPSTGRNDIEDKLPIYRERGDLEIWRIHPYERTITRWVKQPDGRYTEDVIRGGSMTLAAVPQVTVDLDTLFTI